MRQNFATNRMSKPDHQCEHVRCRNEGDSDAADSVVASINAVTLAHMSTTRRDEHSLTLKLMGKIQCEGSSVWTRSITASKIRSVT